MIHFSVPGPPKALQRARVGRVGQHARMYDPEANTTNKATVGWYAKQAMKDRPLLEGPLKLDIVCYIQRPKSKTRKNPRANRMLVPDTKPDWDNLGKMVSDALSGIVYADDRQIIDGRVRKEYADTGSPRTEVEILTMTSTGWE